ARQDFLRAASDLGADRLKWYQTFQEYLDGDQKTLLNDRALLYLRRSGLDFSENFCETIVDSLCARIRIEGFDCDGGKDTYKPTGEDAATDTADGDKPDPAEDLAAQLLDWWRRASNQATAGNIHRTAIGKGDSFLIVDYDQK